MVDRIINETDLFKLILIIKKEQMEIRRLLEKYNKGVKSGKKKKAKRG